MHEHRGQPAVWQRVVVSPFAPVCLLKHIFVTWAFVRPLGRFYLPRLPCSALPALSYGLPICLACISDRPILPTICPTISLAICPNSARKAARWPCPWLLYRCRQLLPRQQPYFFHKRRQAGHSPACLLNTLRHTLHQPRIRPQHARIWPVCASYRQHL